MKQMFQSIYSWLQGVEPLPKSAKIAFQLKLGHLHVGTLRAEDGSWVFSYSDEFRRQTLIKPIVDFPFADREYRSTDLWPFFMLRIPSLKQSAVHEFLKQHPKDSVDEGVLLKEFGNRSIANPFRLEPLTSPATC